MTPIADMVRQMLEKGVAAEAIVLAIQGAELAMSANMSTRHQVDEAAEKRRAWDREYRRRKREIPPDSTRLHPKTENASLSKEEKKEEIQKERETSKRMSGGQRGQRLPEAWHPQSRDWAEAQHTLGRRADGELLKFRDHWKAQPGQKGVKTDWDATWRNWARRAMEYGNGKTKPDVRGGSLLDAFDEVITGTAELDRGERQEAFRLLPRGPGREPT